MSDSKTGLSLGSLGQRGTFSPQQYLVSMHRGPEARGSRDLLEVPKVFLPRSQISTVPFQLRVGRGWGNGVEVLSRPAIAGYFKALCTQCQFSPGQRRQSQCFTQYLSMPSMQKPNAQKEGEKGQPSWSYFLDTVLIDLSGSIGMAKLKLL